MTLHLLRFDPDMVRASAWFAAEGVLPRESEDDGYAWHALLAATFGKTLAPRPFRVLSRRGRPLQLLAYSCTDVAKLTAHAADFADPKAIAALALSTLASKPMPQFVEGRRLGFSVRLRPTIRRDRDGRRDRVCEIDAYVAARDTTPDAALDRASIYRAWAQERLAAAGADVLRLHIVGLDSVNVVRRGTRKAGDRTARHIPGYAATASGSLRVADAEKFAALLARGVGRHRAFGYGMLLLSPPED